MTGDVPMPQLAQFSIELERPCRKERDEAADRDGVDCSDVIPLEAEREGRGDEPQATDEAQPLATELVTAEAEVRRHRERKPANRRIGRGDVVRRIVGQPRRYREPEPEREG